MNIEPGQLITRHHGRPNELTQTLKVVNKIYALVVVSTQYAPLPKWVMYIRHLRGGQEVVFHRLRRISIIPTPIS